MTTEPYGTTPLPAKSVTIRYDPGDDVWDIAQQPKSQQIAAYEGIKIEDSIHGATVLDVNQHFVIYAVKKGLIRILHRHSTLRSLFRGHAGQTVTDIQIFLDGDVLGSVGSANGTSTVIIWRVFERTPEIMSEKLLEITTSAFTISRLIWHPFNPNQFWILHTVSNTDDKKVASLVDTTRISTLPHATEQHAVCMFFQPNIIMESVVSLAAPAASSLTDLDWSEKDVRHVLTTHQGGEIRLWDLRKVDQAATNAATMLPACLCVLQEDQPLSRCKFLPHECPKDQASQRDTAYTNCFLTATHNNSEVTLWSPFGEQRSPTKLQVFGLQHPSPSYVLDICYGPSPPDGPPPALFVLMADQSEGKLFAWHIQSEWQDPTVVSLVGCDFVVPFVTSYPMYSWSTHVQPAADISEDEMTDQGGLVFDMKLFSYQSTVVQCLILTSFMCLPPARQWDPSTPGVIVEDLQREVESVVASAASSNGDAAAAAAAADLALSDDFGDYDVGDDDDEEDDDDDEQNKDDFHEPPAASSLPVPDGLDSPAAAPAPAAGGGAFANWLGALAVKAPGPAPIPPPPMTQPPAASSTASTTMLTPADLFPNHPSIAGAASGDSRASSRSQEPQPPQNAGNKKKNRKGKSRSRSPAARNNQGGGAKKEQQQQPENVTILQRKSDDVASPVVAAPMAPPPPGMAVSSTATGVSATNQNLAELFRQQQVVMAKEIQKTVQNEMKSTLVPIIDQKVRESVKQAVEPVLSSMNSIGKNGVQVDHDRLVNAITAKVEAPLRAAFAENMKTVLIPAFESVSGQMFAQISSSLEGGMAQKDASGSVNSSKLDDITSQLATMTSLVKKLSSEVDSLRSMMTEQSMRGRAESLASSAGITGAAEQQQVLEQEVLVLLGQRQYEPAFTKALSASTVEMALFVCRHADLSDVLGGNSPALSQPILLCLMHQLGTSVVAATDDNNLQTELAWLQEVSLSINPMDESMRRHLPGVLQQLVTGISEKMARTDQQARRPLQRLLQVLRGVQVQ